MRLQVRLASLALLSGLVVLILAVIPGVTAQNPTPTLTPTPVPLPACQLYYVTVDEGVVRSCAGTGCSRVGGVRNQEVVCVLGVSETPGWLLIDPEPQNADSPIRYISADIVAPGLPGYTGDVDCEAWEITVPEAVVRRCAAETCAVVGGLPQGTQMCVKEYGGQYEDWLYVDYSSYSPMNGWVFVDVAQRIPAGTPVAIPTPNRPLVIPASILSGAQTQPVALQVTPSPTTAVELAPPTLTPTATLPVCPPGVVTVGGAGELPAYAAEYPFQFTYVVRAGDTLQGVAGRFSTTVDVIRQANALQPAAVILVGQRLIIPVQTADVPGQIVEPVSASAGAPACVTATPTPILAAPQQVVASGPLIAQDVALASFQVSNVDLVSPRSAAQFRLDLPTDWQLDGNNVLYLNLEYTQNLSPLADPMRPLVSILNVRLDDTLISSTTLTAANVGLQTLVIPLPSSLLVTPERTNSHRIDVTFMADDFCDSNSLARAFIRSDLSYFHFEYHRLSPSLDLARYPEPFYHGTVIGTEPETVWLVLPDEPSLADLESAAGIAAALGQLTFGELRIRAALAGGLTDQIRRENNLLLVGEIGKHALIDQLYADNALPTQLSGNVVRLSGQEVAESIGLVQLIANPDNPMRAIGVVTGLNEAALRKAAQALSGPPSVLSLGGPLALVSDVRPKAAVPVGMRTETTLTFAELGVTQMLLAGIGTQTASVRFTAPATATIAPDASVDLIFTYSGALGRGSTVTVLVNNTPIASTLLALESVTGGVVHETDELGRNHLRGRIPPESIQPGAENTLTILVNGIDSNPDDCVFPDPLVAWFNVSPESSIFLPTQTADPAAVTPLLSWFPVPFTSLPDLSDVLISLPRAAGATEIEQGLRMVARLGAETVGGEAFRPRFSVGDLPEGIDLAQYHLIVIGRPSTNPLLAALNADLPQPFVPGTDTLEQKLDDVVYQLPPGYDVGLLEIVKSPWSPERAILVIAGLGDRGQADAVRALADNIYWRGDLEGDVVFVSPNSIAVIDTRTVYAQEDLVTALPELATQSAIAAQATSTPIPVYTVTPGPTPTATATNTPTPVVTATPIVPLPSPTAPTPIPTFPPLDPEQLQPARIGQPEWVNILLVITAVVLVTTILFGILVAARSRRRP
ncbi:MAG: LysM peptidoglycan-binding domain-containing protein [Anaerolineae bacterium]|nr:LysM peptidoglycan-binding domain-containing protein [Anaerolineae bacterium]